jgi:hypothetical protein
LFVSGTELFPQPLFNLYSCWQATGALALSVNYQSRGLHDPEAADFVQIVDLKISAATPISHMISTTIRWGGALRYPGEDFLFSRHLAYTLNLPVYHHCWCRKNAEFGDFVKI